MLGGARGFAVGADLRGRRTVMRPLMHVRRHDQYFHSHPLQNAFSLIASLILAGLVVIALLVSTAH